MSSITLIYIKAGEKIGIVGRSGAGKSTLIQLLLHFYHLKEGAILIDGQNIEDVTQDSLRANIALVTQDTSLPIAQLPKILNMAVQMQLIKICKVPCIRQKQLNLFLNLST